MLTFLAILFGLRMVGLLRSTFKRGRLESDVTFGVGVIVLFSVTVVACYAFYWRVLPAVWDSGIGFFTGGQ